jgi:hypothetical protein
MLAVASAVAIVAVVATGATLTVQGDDRAGTDSSAAAAEVGSAHVPRGVPVHARLLPDIRSLPAEDVSVREVPGGRELRFAGVLANEGVAPLETVPDPAVPCPPGQRHASQAFFHDSNGDGRFDRGIDVETSTRAAGCMLFHPEHGHWHFDSSARYALTAAGSAAPVVAVDKVSFCLRDNRVAPEPADVPPPAHYGGCERDIPQGISPGWADVYGAELPAQALALPPGMPDGTYCLHIEADPFDLLLESDEDDNASVVALRIAGLTVAADDPTACAGQSAASGAGQPGLAPDAG